MNRRLLILDDEPGILDAYRIILSGPSPSMAKPVLASSRRAAAAPALAAAEPIAESAPFEVTFASSGEEALASLKESLAQNRPFAGGFFDVKLGGNMDGIETMRQVKDLDQDFLCVMVTAYQDRSLDEITKLFGEAFADRWDFLTKPFAHNEILQKARNISSNWDRRKRERAYLQQIEQQQEMLIRQERLAAMGTLARGIGHEFGNILLRIIGKAEIAKSKNDPKEMNDALGVIAVAAERAGVVIRNLRGLVRMETERELVDVQAARRVLALIDFELKKAGVTLIEKHEEEKLPAVLMSRVEIGQVFLNLLINAIHAMEPKGGELRITSQRVEDGVLVEVRDTGCGIAPENLSKIFEPLFTTKGDRGSGIGLSVTRKIIENHNGRLMVQSRVGVGTAFSLWLPVRASVHPADLQKR